jgi:hypothetical protein
MTSRVEQRDPTRSIGQLSRAEADGTLGRRRPSLYLEVEVELLGMVLAGPLGRDMVGSELKGYVLAVLRPDDDPVGFLSVMSQPANPA